VGEVVRRITGRSLGRFFSDEIAEPRGAHFHNGLPEEHEGRVGSLIASDDVSLGANAPDPASVAGRSLGNPPIRGDGANVRAWRAAEIPAANGTSNARAVAKVAGAVANGDLLDEATISLLVEEQSFTKDLVLGLPIRFGLGFGLTSAQLPIGPNPRTFFWGGWGGSLAVFDPDARLGFAYVMNRMGSGTLGDTRGFSLAMALYSSLQSA
jgi:CubicO group peptidase (beta-lactamase class C family)